jgi:DNA-binding transcriptional MerR regulator
MSPETRSYTSAEVARIAAVTLRQLQWWHEHGVLSAVQVGHKRVYAVQELFAALLFRELRARGFSLEDVRRIQKHLRQQRIVLPSESHRWLLTNGERVVLLEHADVVLAFLEQRRSPVYRLISLDALEKRMQQESEKLPSRRGSGRARLIRESRFRELIRRQA